MTDKEKIRNNFSRYARRYDRYSTIQDKCSLRLIDGIRGKVFPEILDIGCGTGNYTRLLRTEFPDARIKALDISDEMVKLAKNKISDGNVEFIVADGENFSFKNKFNLISSNVSFQWFSSLKEALSKYRDMLYDKGAVYFSTFGPLTFYELQESLWGVLGESAVLNASGFLGQKEILKIMKDNYIKVSVDQDIYKEEYSSLRALFEKIKYTGARGTGLTNKKWTAKIMSSIEKEYIKKFRKITATYQIFFCKGHRGPVSESQ